MIIPTSRDVESMPVQDTIMLLSALDIFPQVYFSELMSWRQSTP